MERVVGVGSRVPGEEAVDDGLDVWVAEGEDFSGGGEDDDPDLHAAEGAELARLLEEPRPPLREGNLEVVLHFDFLDLDLLSTHARFLAHGGFYLIDQSLILLVFFFVVERVKIVFVFFFFLGF